MPVLVCPFGCVRLGGILLVSDTDLQHGTERKQTYR